jgi:preprotein translocase subunit SecA
MERLGVEEGEHIESRMVTRAVEKAQKKVEAMHFEARKHILEFDDVANEQRKTVFKFRMELLNPQYDIKKKIEENRKEYVLKLFEELHIYPETPYEDYDTERIITRLKELNVVFTSDEMREKDYKELLNHILNRLKLQYEQKMAIAEEKQQREIERILYLQILDNRWREHLYQMDILKTGIGLRGYNQKDPLVEYKKESFNLFMELIEGIKFEVIKTLHTIELRNEEEEDIKKVEEELRKIEEEMSRPYEENKDIPRKKKPRRNDPCPCGSGKKYKHCCGRSGPKKGAIARR